jgi:hypothetical protein
MNGHRNVRRGDEQSAEQRGGYAIVPSNRARQIRSTSP